MALLHRSLAALTTIALLYATSALASGRATLETVSQVATPEVSCELKVKEKYEYYDLDGTTIPALQREINDHGTKWNDGRTYAAVTTWDLRYSYDISNDNGKCSIKTVKTDVDVTYHLPRRTAPGSGPELTALWDRYMVHLKTHEFGHKDLAVKIAGELNESLASLQNLGSQEELEREAKKRTDAKLEELKEVQVDYDHDTRHGATQGAVLAAD